MDCTVSSIHPLPPLATTSPTTPVEIQSSIPIPSLPTAPFAEPNQSAPQSARRKKNARDNRVLYSRPEADESYIHSNQAMHAVDKTLSAYSVGQPPSSPRQIAQEGIKPSSTPSNQLPLAVTGLPSPDRAREGTERYKGDETTTQTQTRSSSSSANKSARKTQSPHRGKRAPNPSPPTPIPACQLPPHAPASHVGASRAVPSSGVNPTGATAPHTRVSI
ncbi:hypothetical protein V502_09340 [Pseudogymnoascus sp. VKM F-4520 (FW-2644)]|nr:hypothetical protein V502_09340 [Pseudogymnoascus sp. VKM F-4520 (FW-2644)]